MQSPAAVLLASNRTSVASGGSGALCNVLRLPCYENSNGLPRHVVRCAVLRSHFPSLPAGLPSTAFRLATAAGIRQGSSTSHCHTSRPSSSMRHGHGRRTTEHLKQHRAIPKQPDRCGKSSPCQAAGCSTLRSRACRAALHRPCTKPVGHNHRNRLNRLNRPAGFLSKRWTSGTVGLHGRSKS